LLLDGLLIAPIPFPDPVGAQKGKFFYVFECFLYLSGELTPSRASATWIAAAAVADLKRSANCSVEVIREMWVGL
jgi:hypothetical protein